MTIAKNNDKVSYTLKDQDLQKVKEEKDIGVTIDDELDFESHISEKINKQQELLVCYAGLLIVLIVKHFYLSIKQW